jgi:hypothetical protein
MKWKIKLKGLSDVILGVNTEIEKMTTKMRSEPSWNLFRKYIEKSEMDWCEVHTGDVVVQKYKDAGEVDLSDYLTAYRWIGEHVSCDDSECDSHWFTRDNRQDSLGKYYDLFSDTDTLKSNYKRNLPQKIIKLVYTFDLTPEEEEMMNLYSVKELKQLVKQNMNPYVFNKKLKYCWMEAYMYTRNWGSRVFLLKSNLPEEVLKIIQSYLPVTTPTENRCEGLMRLPDYSYEWRLGYPEKWLEMSRHHRKYGKQRSGWKR